MCQLRGLWEMGKKNGYLAAVDEVVKVLRE